MVIHLCGLMDLSMGIGWVLYQDDTIEVQSSLVWPMISSLDTFTREVTGQKRGFRKAVLEDIQFLVYHPDADNSNLRYCIINDRYDNAEYTIAKVDKIHPFFDTIEDLTHYSLGDEEKSKVKEILSYTMKFPIEKITTELRDEVKDAIAQLNEKGAIFIDLFIADIDEPESVVCDFVKRTELMEKSSSMLFADLLSSVSFEKDLWLDTYADKEKQQIHGGKGVYEGWIVNRLGEKSDFFMVGYFIFPLESKEDVRKKINELAFELKKTIE